MLSEGGIFCNGMVLTHVASCARLYACLAINLLGPCAPARAGVNSFLHACCSAGQTRARRWSLRAHKCHPTSPYWLLALPRTRKYNSTDMHDTSRLARSALARDAGARGTQEAYASSTVPRAAFHAIGGAPIDLCRRSGVISRG